MTGRRWRAALLLGLAVFAGGTTVSIAAASPPTGRGDDPWLVLDVVDGDTLDVARGDELLTVRLIGINAPESDECWAPEATDALAGIVGHGPVWLAADVSDVDAFGRALRYVFDADGEDVGAQLVERGAAIARSYPPDVANDARYALLQEAARQAHRGLWAADACPSLLDGTTPTEVSVAIEVHPDAAGDDNENLNDEWVRFTNTGDVPLDLDGWRVRDESSSHRYVFADLVLAAGASVTLYSGCGADTATARHWCKTDSAVWNNSGDTVFLLDPAGNIVAEHRYTG